MKIVIIGSGAAGISAIQTIRENCADKEIHITLISAGRELAYSPCTLPYVISDSIPYKRLGRLDSNFYKKNKIQTFWGSPVCRINPAKKSIALKNGKTFFYDKLLIAAGSVPIKPPIPGIDKTGVFFVDTLKNTRRIKDYIRKERIAKLGKKVAIIGAGFTGIETALALRQQGINVIVIEMLDRILAKVLDDDFARIAHKKINAGSVGASGLPASNGKKEIEFKLSTAVTEIRGKNKVKSLLLHNGKNIPVDMAIVSVGVRPNIDFLKDTGITLNKGIIVNERMQTNEPDIYAAGDTVETVDYITGEPTISAIWPNAIEQGKAAGLNMLGKETIYPGASSINVLNLEGTPVISMGRIFNEKITANQPHMNGSYTYRNENSLRRIFFSYCPCEAKRAYGQLDPPQAGHHNSAETGSTHWSGPNSAENSSYCAETGKNEPSATATANPASRDKNNITIVGFESIGEFRNLGHIWSMIQKKAPASEMDPAILMDNTAPIPARTGRGA